MIDIIIPTYKSQHEVADQVRQMTLANDLPFRITPTCQDAPSPVNRNIGLEAAKSDVVIMVDDDISDFPPRWDLKLVLALRASPRCVMVSARLMNPDGTPGGMLRTPPRTKETGLTAVNALPMACVAFHNDGLRFDENFVGSGFEDDDFCAQLRLKYPDGVFLINEDVRVVHRNEMKEQGFIKGKGPVPGGNFEKNLAYYERKWADEHMRIRI